MTVQFISRQTWFAGTPTSNNGSPRPKLATPVPTITRHYTGSPVSTKASTWPAKDWMPLLQSIALGRTNPASFEYNYVIPPRADGTAQIWEYAGTYQAAHSAGENDVAVGVLFAIGVNNHPSYSTYDPNRPTQWEPLTDPMVEAYRYLRDEILARQGIIHPSYVVEVEHRNMPGANTACPGAAITLRAADLSAPYAPPPPPEPPEEPEVSRLLWRHTDFKNVFIIEAGDVLHATESLLAAYGLKAQDAIVESHPQMLKSCVNKAGIELSDLVKV